MKTIGFPISKKENENRRAILPCDIKRIEHPEYIYIENSYGNVLGIDDNEYIKAGANICSRDEILKKDIICDPKVGDAEYLELLNHQTVFGWVHATQNKDITEKLVNTQSTAYAWEKMYENGKHVFWFNNELAGEAAIINGFQCFGKLPYGLQVAVIGRGNTARGACRVLNMLGANVTQYYRNQEELLRNDISKYDAIVNCILWDITRKDHIIYRKDLKNMKKDSIIIDVSCDKNGGIETSRPTTIEEPIYYVDGIMHYAVDHTPSIFYKTFSTNNSSIIVEYINDLINETSNDTLNNSIIISNGVIIDNDINVFQNR